MTLFTTEQEAKLKENGMLKNTDKDHSPVVHLTLPGTNCEWLLSELNPDHPHIAFGLCDLGMGHPELGYVDLIELQSVEIGIFKFTIFNNLMFEAKYPMSVYAAAARDKSAITRKDEILLQYHERQDYNRKHTP